MNFRWKLTFNLSFYSLAIKFAIHSSNHATPLKPQRCIMCFFLWKTIFPKLFRATQTEQALKLNYITFPFLEWFKKWNLNCICFVLNTYHAAGESRRQLKNFRKYLKTNQHYKNWWLGLYMESPWEMHSNKYKHA